MADIDFDFTAMQDYESQIETCDARYRRSQQGNEDFEPDRPNLSPERRCFLAPLASRPFRKFESKTQITSICRYPRISPARCCGYLLYN
jgi:hypothetical protein